MATCGTGPGNNPDPGDPNLSSSILSVATVDGGIMVSWTYPTINPNALAYTLVYRNTTADFGTVGTPIVATGTQYYDKTDAASTATYYYWIKMVSIYGTEGAVIGPASALMHPLADQFITLLSNQITNQELASELKARIDEIDALEISLSAETVSRLTEDGIITSLVGDVQTQLNSVDALVVNETTARIAGDSALVVQIDAIASTSGDNAAAIIAEAIVRANADAAMATNITTLFATTSTNAGGIISNTALVATEASARTTADSAIAADVVTVEASVVTVDGRVDTANVTIAAHTTAISNTDGDVATLEAKYGVSLNVNGYVTGFVQNNDGTSGTFVILADKFAIVDPSGDPAESEFVPFGVSGGVVFMQNVQVSGSLVVANSITAAKLNVSTLSSITANIGTITAGSITLDSSGYIKGGQTAFNTGTGFFLGYSSGAYKFSIGSSASGNYLTWDGSVLTVKGNMVVGHYVLSDNVILSALTERSDNGPQGGWTTYKTFTVGKDGDVRLVFQRRVGSNTDIITYAQYQVTINSVQHTNNTVTATTYTSTTIDLTGLSAGDVIDINLIGGSRNPAEPVNFAIYIKDVYIKADVELSPGGTVDLN